MQVQTLGHADHGARAHGNAAAVGHPHPVAPVRHDVEEIADLLALVKAQVGDHIDRLAVEGRLVTLQKHF